MNNAREQITENREQRSKQNQIAQSNEAVIKKL
jgi:hypothetical protein